MTQFGSLLEEAPSKPARFPWNSDCEKNFPVLAERAWQRKAKWPEILQTEHVDRLEQLGGLLLLLAQISQTVMGFSSINGPLPLSFEFEIEARVTGTRSFRRQTSFLAGGGTEAEWWLDLGHRRRWKTEVLIARKIREFLGDWYNLCSKNGLLRSKLRCWQICWLAVDGHELSSPRQAPTHFLLLE
jgi:hypothetical protein